MDVIIPSVDTSPFACCVFHVVPINIAYIARSPQKHSDDPGAACTDQCPEECGILMRIAYWIIKPAADIQQNTYAPVSGGVGVGHHLFLRPLSVVDLLTYGICKAMGFGKSKEGTLMMMVGGIAALNVKLFAYRPATMSIMVSQVQTVDPLFGFLLRSDALQFPFRFDGIVVHMDSYENV